MVAYIFDDILLKGVRAGQIPARTKSAREWYRNKASTVSATPTNVISNKTNIVRGYSVGEMMLFNYSPKHKNKLPYYDTFPLVFPIEPAAGGFLGLNMHYLPLRQRAFLMDALYTTVNNQRYDSSTALNISYSILKNASKFKLFKPCVKHYLNSHIKSRRVLIDAVEWDIALFLPLQRFQKGGQSAAWKDSLKVVNA